MNNEVPNQTQPETFTVEKASDKDGNPALKYQGQSPLKKPSKMAAMF